MSYVLFDFIDVHISLVLLFYYYSKAEQFIEDDINYNVHILLNLFSDSKSPGDAKYSEAFGKN